MSIHKYDEKTEKIWNKAEECDCKDEDYHPNNHRLCGISGVAILYGSHESVESQKNSQYAWNIDHMKPKSRCDTDKIENLQAVHIYCNQEKADN